MNTVILLFIIIVTIFYGITWYVISNCFFHSNPSEQFFFLTMSVSVFRILPRVIGYYFIKRFNIQIKFGRWSVPFTLRAVTIIKNGFSIVRLIAHHNLPHTSIAFSNQFLSNERNSHWISLPIFCSKSMKLRYAVVFSIRKWANCYRLQYVTFE